MQPVKEFAILERLRMQITQVWTSLESGLLAKTSILWKGT